MLCIIYQSWLSLGFNQLGTFCGAGRRRFFQSIRNSIAGVAISVSLVPPLAVAGIGLALGRKATADVGLSFREVGLFSGGTDIAVGASVLFLTNLAAIVVVAGTVMAIQGYARWKRGIFGLAGAIAVSIVLMQPLSEELYKLRVKSMVLRLVKTLPVTHPDTYESSLRLDTLRVRREDDVLHVLGEGTMLRDGLEGYPARLELFRRELEEKAGEPVIVEIEAVPVDIVHFRSAPDGDKDQLFER